MRLDLPDLSLSLATDAGVFSAGGVDAGSKLLLLTVPPPPPAGHLLDLGCGYGPTRADHGDALAGRDGVGGRRERAGPGAVRPQRRRPRASPTSVSSLPPTSPTTSRFAAIWSNPPIRIGKAALHELLSGWLRRLADGAAAHLVVQRHLGADSLSRWLEGEGFTVRRLASRQAYRVLDVRRDEERS